MLVNSWEALIARFAPTLVEDLIEFTYALNFMTNSSDLLLLDHSHAFYCISDSSVNLALLQAIASLQQTTHKAKCTLWAFLQSVFHLYVHIK